MGETHKGYGTKITIAGIPNLPLLPLIDWGEGVSDDTPWPATMSFRKVTVTETVESVVGGQNPAPAQEN